MVAEVVWIEGSPGRVRRGRLCADFTGDWTVRTRGLFWDIAQFQREDFSALIYATANADRDKSTRNKNTFKYLRFFQNLEQAIPAENQVKVP